MTIGSTDAKPLPLLSCYAKFNFGCGFCRPIDFVENFLVLCLAAS
jgi:hypothetical protein